MCVFHEGFYFILSQRPPTRSRVGQEEFEIIVFFSLSLSPCCKRLNTEGGSSFQPWSSSGKGSEGFLCSGGCGRPFPSWRQKRVISVRWRSLSSEAIQREEGAAVVRCQAADQRGMVEELVPVDHSLRQVNVLEHYLGDAHEHFSFHAAVVAPHCHLEVKSNSTHL